LLRQFGHAIIEPPCHDKEELLLGFNTLNKSVILGAYVLIPIISMVQAGAWTFAGFLEKLPAIAQQWFGLTLLVVLGRVVYLAWLHDVRTSMIWFVKLITDPLTDIMAYTPRFIPSLTFLMPTYARRKVE
jgi:glutamate-1-semialdehyde 2,1-aminomutase